MNSSDSRNWKFGAWLLLLALAAGVAFMFTRQNRPEDLFPAMEQMSSEPLLTNHLINPEPETTELPTTGETNAPGGAETNTVAEAGAP